MARDDGKFTPEEVARQEPAGSAATGATNDKGSTIRRRYASMALTAALFADHLLATDAGLAAADRQQPRDVGPQDAEYLAELRRIRSADVIIRPVAKPTITITSSPQVISDPKTSSIPPKIGSERNVTGPDKISLSAQVTAESPFEPKIPGIGGIIFDNAKPGSGTRIIPTGVDVTGLGKQTLNLSDILNDPPGHTRRGEILPPRRGGKGPAA